MTWKITGDEGQAANPDPKFGFSNNARLGTVRQNRLVVFRAPDSAGTKPLKWDGSRQHGQPADIADEFRKVREMAGAVAEPFAYSKASPLVRIYGDISYKAVPIAAVCSGMHGGLLCGTLRTFSQISRTDASGA